jgi:DNA-binding MarR family transcriptional regulator
MTTNAVNIIVAPFDAHLRIGPMTERRARQQVDPDDGLAVFAGSDAAKAPTRLRNGGGRPNLDVLRNHLGYFLRRAQVSVFQDFIQALSSINIRPAQYSVLVVIGANPGLSQADVSELLGIERARLVRLLDRLEKRGLMQRLASPTDRRSHALKLTASGRAILKRAKALAATHETRLLERLGAVNHQMMLDALRDFDLSQ